MKCTIIHINMFCIYQQRYEKTEIKYKTEINLNNNFDI